MAGHSKWKNIQRTKQAQDKKRASNFTKLSKDITNAVKLGDSGDPGFNPILKVTIDRAKALNMPNDNINRAIEKGLGNNSDDTLTYENIYEFYGPEGSTFVVDTETDNPNRTITDLKIIANKNNLKLANQGSISWQYKEIGKIIIENVSSKISEDFVLDVLNFDGINDLKEQEDSISISCERTDLKKVADQVQDLIKKYADNEFAISEAGIIKIAENTLELEPSNELQAILDALQEVDEVVNVWTNFDKSFYE